MDTNGIVILCKNCHRKDSFSHHFSIIHYNGLHQMRFRFGKNSQKGIHHTIVTWTSYVDRCPYGDFLRDSRRVVGPSSSSPVYHIINGPRQKKKTVSQNNTQIDNTREPYKEYVSSSIITICTTCFVQLKRELKLNNPNRQVIQT